LIAKLNEYSQKNELNTVKDSYLLILKQVDSQAYEEFITERRFKEIVSILWRYILLPALILSVITGLGIAIKKFIVDYIRAETYR